MFWNWDLTLNNVTSDFAFLTIKPKMYIEPLFLIIENGKKNLKHPPTTVESIYSLKNTNLIISYL